MLISWRVFHSRGEITNPKKKKNTIYFRDFRAAGGPYNFIVFGAQVVSLWRLKIA